MEVLGAIGLLLLVAHGVAYAVLVAGLARKIPPWRVVVALAFPPLGALWAWEAGLRRRTIAYGATLAVFAVVLTATNLVR